MAPSPIRPLAWLLRVVSSRDAANAAIGDCLEVLEERSAAGLQPRWPVLWVNLHTLRAIVLAAASGAPRLARSAGLIVRDAARALLATPSHSLFIVGVLATGIAAGTITFSVVDAVIFKPLPVAHADQVVFISTRDKGQPRITPEVYWQLRVGLGSVETLAAHSRRHGTRATVADLAHELPVVYASADIFGLLRLSPVVGRFWTTADEVRGDTSLAVLGHGFWRQHFGRDPSILGKAVTIGTKTYRVIGVLSETSDRPELDLLSTPIWVPADIPRTGSQTHAFGLMARMRPGVSPAQVAEEVGRITAVPGWVPQVTRLLDWYVQPVRRWLLLALGAAAVVVLIACVNAANMMLTRSAGRAQELAIRASLGASRRHIALTVVTEGLLLSFAATVVALGLSVIGVRAARAAVMTMLFGVFRAETIVLNGRVLAAAIAAAVVTGLLFSIVPAWQTSRVPVLSLLKDAEAPTATGRRGWRSAFLVAEIAMVAVLLVVSWLFVASLIRVMGIDLGIDRAYLLAVKPNIDFQGTVDDVRARLARVPGVSDIAVATGASLPLIGQAFGGAWGTTALSRVELGGSSGSDTSALQYRVTPNYFEVAGLKFLRGGPWADNPAPSAVVVLDERVAGQLFGDDNPIGRQVRGTAPDGIFTVIGTVPYVHTRGPEAIDPPSAYFPLQQNPARMFAGLFVKTSRPPEDMLAEINKALEPVAPATKDPFVFAADDALRRLTATRRFNAGLMSAFGLVGLLIAAAGVYAVMAAFVAQQTREISVRVALGATPAHVQRRVLALAGRHLLAGLTLGVPTAWWLSRGFAALLFQVTAADWSVYVGVATVLVAAGIMAAWIPARRATSIDPIVSLRR